MYLWFILKYNRPVSMQSQIENLNIMGVAIVGIQFIISAMCTKTYKSFWFAFCLALLPIINVLSCLIYAYIHKKGPWAIMVSKLNKRISIKSATLNPQKNYSENGSPNSLISISVLFQDQNNSIYDTSLVIYDILVSVLA